ncbi:glucosaminidase domain-containing protein [Ammoniphilus sp. 3BR4]|uniref:glucosaminidase domain-containing protein n=1 Tax=Ammoniphilus sp. 3BR4 TaxID=3158265 RepID=UPI0034666812
MGKNKAALKQMIDFVQAVNPHFNTMITYYFLEISAKYGVRGDIAFCQSIHETNWFLFGGDVKPEQNNFAGIGATGGVPGHSFSTMEEGITAQMQHLFAYATANPLPQGEKQADPRFHLVTRGSAPNWEDLSGK